MHPARHRPAFLSAALAALAAVLTLVLPATASAATSSAARPRVGALTTQAILTVGSSQLVSPGQGRDEARPQAQFAAGAYVAAEDTSGGAQLGQDIAVNPTAPRALPLDRPISASDTQNAFLQERIAGLQEQGATDLRVNQQQVDITGTRVGINRPDLQYTLNGQRFYEEFETGSLQDALLHGPRILANDPSGIFTPYWVP